MYCSQVVCAGCEEHRCEEHDVLDCRQCVSESVRRMECAYDGWACRRPVTHRIVYRGPYGIVHVRGFCEYHATSPTFAFAREDAVVERIS